MIRIFFCNIRSRHCRALLFGTSVSLAALATVNAQAPGGADDTQETERVIVTGSNIPTAAEVGSAPVTTLDQQAIARTGTDDPQVALQMSDPSFTGGGNLGTSNADISATSTNGGSEVSLRGLPTLVLLDGRRIADSAALAAEGSQFQDVNLFPASLIKRIEILKDGASAIYGSDAVGGVVNVLLDNDYEGFEISGRYGFAEKGDISDNRESAIFGAGDDKTRIVVAGQYEQQDPVLFTQRQWAQVSNVTNFGYDGYVSSNIGGAITVAGQSYFLNTGINTPLKPSQIPTNLNSPNQVVAPGSITPLLTSSGTQVFSISQFPAGTYTTNANLGNLTQYNGITLDEDRLNFYGSVERSILDKFLNVFGSFIYSQNYSQSFLAPQPVSTNSSPDPTENMTIPIGSPYNPFNATIGDGAGTLGNTTAKLNGTEVSAGNLVVTNRFLSDPRVFRNDTDFYRVVAGIKGELTKDVNYELAFNHSQDEIFYKNFNLIRSDLLDEAIAGGYTATGAPDPATFTTNAAGQTVVATPAGRYSEVNGRLLPALDPFAYQNPASTERAIFGTDVLDQQSKLTVIDGELNAFPADLPAGPLGVAVGGEYRQEGLKLDKGVENFVASVPVSDIEVGRGIEAGYGEVSIPVVSSSMKIPGIYSVDIDGAGRYEKYEGTNSSATPKVSFIYRPIIDVALRGTYSKAFVAPNLIQTHGAPSDGFTDLVDLGAGYAEQANTVATSNPKLGPTRADTWSGGIVISPQKVPGLTITGDFFHVEEEGIVGSTVTPDSVLLEANALGSASPYNSLIHYGSPTGPNLTSPKPGQITGNAGDYFVVTTLENDTQLRESGVDFSINYDHDFGPKFGGVTVGLNGTYYLQAKENQSLGGPDADVIGLYLGETIGDSTYTPQYKLAPYLEYRYGGATLSALGNYTPSLREGDYLDVISDRKGDYTTEFEGNLPKIRDYYDIDMTLSYEFGLKKPSPAVPTVPAEGKDAKGAGQEAKGDSLQMAKQMVGVKLLDGVKVTLGVNNVTNGKPPSIPDSPDSTNIDASLYDPFQRYYYFVISKKF
jgi:iron complex outermembrane receptor protein